MAESGKVLSKRDVWRSSLLIFVTVGNATQGFRRLLDAVEEIAGSGSFGTEEVIIQFGHNEGFSSKYCEARAFFGMDEFCQLMEKAETIICHSGCGTMYHALRLGKIPVVMPRRGKYGEHLNDHQVQLVEALAAQKRIVPAYEPAELPEAVNRSRTLSASKVVRDSPRLIELVSSALEDLLGGTERKERSPNLL